MSCRPPKCGLYITIFAEFYGQPFAARVPAWIPTSARRASWARPTSISRLLIREANPAPSAAIPSSESPSRTAAPTSVPDASLQAACLRYEIWQRLDLNRRYCHGIISGSYIDNEGFIRVKGKTGFATIRNATMDFEVSGGGKPLLLLHSGIADHRMWAVQCSEFSSRFQVIMPDFRGYGKSPAPGESFRTMKTFMDLSSTWG